MIMTPTQHDRIRPFDARMINVGDGHWLYVEEVGVRGGRPCLFLHGGPGSGAQHLHRALFNPDRDHAILFDQRGSGRSYPYLSLQANTTAHLIADIEIIREHFGIARWLVTGGSWGSTLALAYAQAHPDRVTALVLRAIFLGTRAEVSWAFEEGPKRFRPELYEIFRGWLPLSERADPIAAYVARLLDPDPSRHVPAAHVWNSYERALSELTSTGNGLATRAEADARVPPTAIMEAHYIAHDFFLKPEQLYLGAARLAHIPGVIVQGRYDLLCPPQAAHALAARWSNCRVHYAETAGHAMTEAGVMQALRQAIADFETDADKPHA